MFKFPDECFFERKSQLSIILEKFGSKCSCSVLLCLTVMAYYL